MNRGVAHSYTHYDGTTFRDRKTDYDSYPTAVHFSGTQVEREFQRKTVASYWRLSVRGWFSPEKHRHGTIDGRTVRFHLHSYEA